MSVAGLVQPRARQTIFQRNHSAGREDANAIAIELESRYSTHHRVPGSVQPFFDDQRSILVQGRDAIVQYPDLRECSACLSCPRALQAVFYINGATGDDRDAVAADVKVRDSAQL